MCVTCRVFYASLSIKDPIKKDKTNNSFAPHDSLKKAELNYLYYKVIDSEVPAESENLRIFGSKTT